MTVANHATAPDPVAGKRVVVIGAGIAGLATAGLLARAGAAVTVVEARDEIGGRAATWSRDGFTFDLGPSWYLMPEVFEHFFRMMGTTTADQLDLVDLDPGYRVYFEGDPDPVDMPRGTALETLIALDPAHADELRRYARSAAETYRLAVDRFLYTTFSSLRGFLAPEVLARLPRLARLLTQPLSAYVASHTGDHRVRQILGYPAVFLGGAPARVPSMYHLMSHLDVADGVKYPRGGFGALMRVVADLATANDATIRTSTPATKIEVRDGSVAGVWVRSGDDDHFLAADVVVSSADLDVTEHRLLEPEHRSFSRRWWRRRDPGPGAVLAMLGVRGHLPALEHHTLLFTRDWEAGFEAIFGETPTLPDPASIYVCRPSATDDVAPDGHENLFVLIPVRADPAIGHGGINGAGSAEVERIVDAAIAQIGTWTGSGDLADRIVVRRSMGPADFADDYGAWRGGALGPGHTLRQSAFFRGSNASRKVNGLLYAGATTIPGVGLPMCVISAELVLKRLRGRPFTGSLPGADVGLMYLGCLMVSLVCIVAIDLRFRLFLGHAPGRALAVLGCGMVFFLAWDLLGISLGIFFRAETTWMTGIVLARELPLEEPIFLLFLCELTMVAFTAALRAIATKRADRGER